MNKIIRNLILCTLQFALAFAACAQDADKNVARAISPDGLNEVRLEIGEEGLKYSVWRRGKAIVEPTELALKVGVSWLNGREEHVPGAEVKTEERKVEGTLATPIYKKSAIDLAANETKVDFGDWAVRLHARNDGVAWRFETEFDSPGTPPAMLVTAESTTVRFPKGSELCYTVAPGFMSGWEKPAQIGPVESVPAGHPQIVMTPFTATVPGAGVVTVTESDLREYPGLNFYRREGETDTLRSWQAGFPKEYEGGCYGIKRKIKVASREPYLAKTVPKRTFPWRVFVLGDTPSDLVSSDAVYALAAPQSRLHLIMRGNDFSWVKPGKVAWDWWNGFKITDVPGLKTGCNFETYKEYVNFAAANGIEYIIMDEGWSEKLDPEKMREGVNVPGVIAYAREKGVGVILWAAWAPLFDREMRIRVFERYAAMGAKGFKIDFIERDDQEAERFLEETAAEAADYHLLVMYHGIHKPTGLQRTYPNILNYEGVYGLEQGGSIGGRKVVVSNDINLVYTRMVAGFMDYTPGAMRNRAFDAPPFDKAKDARACYGTRCHQLALFPLFEAPIQMLCDSPTQYRTAPECTAFIAETPTVWDETAGVAGEIGKYAAVARRKGGEWWLGAITNWEPRELELPTSFLGEGEWEVEAFADAPDADVNAENFTRRRFTVKAGKSIMVRLAPGGGFAAKFTPLAPASSPLRVMTYNIRNSAQDKKTDNSWTARREDMAKLIERENPDIVGFQEVLPDQRKWLAGRFPGYTIVGEGRNADRKHGEGSQIMFRSSRFEAVRSGTFWLSETPDEPGSKSWGAALPRICTYAILKDAVNGGRFAFANTHTDHKSETAREKGMLLIIERMKDFGKDCPIVFVGDHNCLEYEKPALAVAGLLDDAMYKSETQPQGSWRTFNFWHWQESELSIADVLKLDAASRSVPGDSSWQKRIDYIYVSRGTRVLAYRTMPETRPGTRLYPSDHFPTVADLVLPQAGVSPARASISIKVEDGDFPGQRRWAEKELVPKLEEWTHNISRLLDGGDGAGDWGEITLELSKKPEVAHAVVGRGLFRLNMDWAEKSPDEVAGACVHELAHLLADYRPDEGRAKPWNACPAWLSEGIADWVRWCNFEGEAGIADVTARAKARPKHDDSYRITAAFLDWVVKNRDPDFVRKLNKICRDGSYSEQTWVELTGKTRLGLAAEWRRALLGQGRDSERTVSSASKADVLEWVDPFIGTGGTGHTTPAATVPFGMVQPGPDTGRGNWKYCSGYQYSDREIARFSQTHLSGTGCFDFSDVAFMPFAGDTAAAAAADFYTGYDKASERATPGYYAVTLKGGVRVEATATPRAAIYRLTYPGKGGKLLFDPSWCQQVLEKIISTDVSPMVDRRVSGRIDRKGWPDHCIYFAWETSAQPAAETVCERRGGDASPLAVYTFDETEVYLKVAVSRSSEEGARRNIDAEIPGWDFEGVKSAAEAKWREMLGRVEAKGTEEQLVTLYTAIYHVLFQPNLISDAGEKDEYSTFSTWDTYRAAGPLYTILAPEYVSAFVNSFIAHFDRNGFLPIWTLWGLDNQCMIGAHSIPMLVDAYLKGFDGVDWQKAFRCVKSTLVKERRRRKANYDILAKYGYYPFDLVSREGVARLLENCYDDACAARMAAGLGKTEDAGFFAARSHFWTNCYDAATGFIRAKDSAGRWREPFDPYDLHPQNTYNLDYCEGNAWHWNWHQMHDPDLLVALHGGKEKAADRLQTLFDADPYRGNSGGDGNENGLVGQYCHGNEPCHHVIYYFTLMDRRDLAAKYIKEVADNLYSADFFGLCGNEDCGQMSAWYVYSAFGFFPFDPCGGDYVLGQPFLPEISVKTGEGRRFTVTAEPGKVKAAVKLNGEALGGPVVRHADVMAGGTLEF